MNRLDKINSIRQAIHTGGLSVGSWMQIPHSSVAEIMGRSGYDWVAVDMEHGAISVSQLPDLLRALELGGTLPLVRVAQGEPMECKQALDAGAGGVIVPMIENEGQLIRVIDACRWPPEGNRGVGFSRANLFGKYFDEYKSEAHSPLVVAMIEHVRAIESLDKILQVPGLDAIFIGPYDLSASMGLTGELEHKDVLNVLKNIQEISNKYNVACGIHVVMPGIDNLRNIISKGYRFIAYSIDSVFLVSSAEMKL